MADQAKIKLKVGSIELEYEGDPAFLKEGLESLLITMTDLAKVAPPEENISVDDEDSSDQSGAGNSGGLQLSTNSIAAHLDVKSGPELVISALAHLQLAKSVSGASRKQMLFEMQSATSYYDKNMSKNLTSAISSLVKAKKVNQLGADKYALSASELKNLEAKLANAG
ncbi:hypothetical protein JJB09_11320 [Rhizobium sp. KVB221]|uniref:Uncharacterized protein n=1 Tax=Rhizobium setariae TaxID=2801340 RepID=A0A936YN96_9HYPH|nr:hypothetical protein [Rhizobium setariae]MBL0372618.1 hypothetical protein [Rhizobium setariae]